MYESVLVTLAVAWSATVADIVVESARSSATVVSFVGHTVAHVSPQTGVVGLAALTASAAVGLTATMALVHGARLERRMAADLDAGWDAISHNEAARTRHELFEWQQEELGETIDRLLAMRDRLLDEIQDVGRQTAALRQTILEDQRDQAPEAFVIPDIDIGDDWGVGLDAEDASPTAWRRSG
jgi:hypothetical protein